MFNFLSETAFSFSSTFIYILLTVKFLLVSYYHFFIIIFILFILFILYDTMVDYVIFNFEE